MSPKEYKAPLQSGRGHCKSGLQTVTLELLILGCVSSTNTMQVCLSKLKNGKWGEMEAPWDINVMTFLGLGIKEGQRSINTKLLFEKIKG